MASKTETVSDKTQLNREEMSNLSKEKKIKRVIEIAYRKGILDAKDIGVKIPNKNIKALLITSQFVAHEIYKDYEKLFILKGKV